MNSYIALAEETSVRPFHIRTWPLLLLLIHILEALIINERVYNYWNMDPSFYSSSKTLHGFIKGNCLWMHWNNYKKHCKVGLGLKCFFYSKLIMEAIHNWSFSCIASLSYVSSVLQSSGLKAILLSSVNMYLLRLIPHCRSHSCFHISLLAGWFMGIDSVLFL